MTFWKAVGAVMIGGVVTASLIMTVLITLGAVVESCSKLPTPY